MYRFARSRCLSFMYFLKVPWSRKVLFLSAELITNVEMLVSQT